VLLIWSTSARYGVVPFVVICLMVNLRQLRKDSSYWPLNDRRRRLSCYPIINVIGGEARAARTCRPPRRSPNYSNTQLGGGVYAAILSVHSRRVVCCPPVSAAHRADLAPRKGGTADIDSRCSARPRTGANRQNGLEKDQIFPPLRARACPALNWPLAVAGIFLNAGTVIRAC